MSDIEIVRLSEDMISAVAHIEAECFAEPWSEKSLKLLLGEQGFAFAAVASGTVVAYGGMMCVLDEGQITNVATLPEFRRMGIGRKIMDALEDFAAERGIAMLSLEVRESNIAARKLYASCGWREEGIRKNFYRRPCENGIVMTKKL